MAKQKDSLPKHVHVVRGFAGAPDHIRTHYYNPDEIYEVGSDLLPVDLARSLLNETEPPIEEHGKLDDDEQVTQPGLEEVDPSLDHASGRHQITAMPPETLLRKAIERHLEHTHPEKDAERAKEEGLLPPRSLLNAPLGERHRDQPGQGTLAIESQMDEPKAEPADEPVYTEDSTVKDEQPKQRGQKSAAKREEKE